MLCKHTKFIVNNGNNYLKNIAILRILTWKYYELDKNIFSNFAEKIAFYEDENTLLSNKLFTKNAFVWV